MTIRRLAKLSRLSEFFNSRSGGVLIYMAFAIPVIIGFAGLSVDVGIWYAKKRSIQIAADAGAVAGALEILRSDADDDAIEDAAEADAITNGYDDTEGDVLTVNHPPESGIAKDATDAVEVIVQAPAPTFFSKFFEGFLSSTTQTIAARAVSSVDYEDTCVYALNPDTKAAIKVAGGANISLNCGMKVKSDDPEAVDQSASGSCINATMIKIHAPGWYDGDCVNASEGILTTAEVTDPMIAVDPPVDEDSLSCTDSSNIKASSGETITLDPGTYCGSISTVGTGKIVFNPGLVVLHGAGMSISGDGTIEGDGVTFFITSEAKVSDGINFQSGATVDLSAPADASDGGMPGVLFYQSREVDENVTHHFVAGTNMEIEGTLYFPTSDLNFSGGASVDPSALQLIADTISFTGQSSIGSLDGSVVTSNPALVRAVLVE